MNTQFNNTIFFFYRMSYCAQPLLAMHCSYGAKLFGFDSTNVTINLYLMVLKIAIKFFSTTNTKGSFGWRGGKVR